MENEEFISGIYNYCDRWCERCDFTNRCRVFFDEKKQLRELKDKDNFLEIVSKNFEDTFKLIYKIAEEKNIDLDNIEIDEDEYQKHLEKNLNAMNHPMVKLAASYAEQVDEWLDCNEYLEAENLKYLRNMDLGIDLEHSHKALRIIEEALNIINWYKFQLQVKLASSIRSYPHDPMFEDEIQNRHHMSA